MQTAYLVTVVKRIAPRSVSFLFIGAWAAWGAWICGCATAPQEATPTPAELIERDRAIGFEMSSQFESRIKMGKDTEVSVYLRHLAESLQEAAPDLKGSPVGVLLVHDRHGQWRNYSLPGSRIYLSIGLLRKVEFENELAGAIAMELGHLVNRDVIAQMKSRNAEGSSRYEKVSDLTASNPAEKEVVDYFGPRGIFAFPEERLLAAAELACGIMYRAGYDPRGLVGLWARYQENPAQSPFDQVTLQKLLEKTRRVIAQNAPLRNPIVRSQAFLKVQKRIRKL